MPNLRIVSDIAQADVKLENLAGKAEPRKVNGKEIKMKPDGSPVIVRKASNGKRVEFCRVDDKGKVLKGPLSNGYCDQDGNLAPDIIPYYETLENEHLEAVQNDKTDVFEIKKYEPLDNYLNKYIIDKYYQVKPSQGKSKKDYQRTASLNANTSALKKLWEHLHRNNVVARGVLNITTAGYLPSVGYVRAVEINGNKWSLEIGIFKQAKCYTWVEEKTFKPVKATAPVNQTAQVEEI